MGKTRRSYKGKEYTPTSTQQKKKPKRKKELHSTKYGYGHYSGMGGIYPKHMVKAKKNPPPPFDENGE